VVSDLVEELARISREMEAPIVRVRVRLGALSQLTAQRFLARFADATRGTSLAAIAVEAEESDELFVPGSTRVVLQSVELAG
jgi:hypothetical protein